MGCGASQPQQKGDDMQHAEEGVVPPVPVLPKALQAQVLPAPVPLGTKVLQAGKHEVSRAVATLAAAEAEQLTDGGRQLPDLDDASEDVDKRVDQAKASSEAELQGFEDVAQGGGNLEGLSEQLLGYFGKVGGTVDSQERQVGCGDISSLSLKDTSTAEKRFCKCSAVGQILVSMLQHSMAALPYGAPVGAIIGVISARAAQATHNASAAQRLLRYIKAADLRLARLLAAKGYGRINEAIDVHFRRLSAKLDVAARIMFAYSGRGFLVRSLLSKYDQDSFSNIERDIREIMQDITQDHMLLVDWMGAEEEPLPSAGSALKELCKLAAEPHEGDWDEERVLQLLIKLQRSDPQGLRRVLQRSARLEDKIIALELSALEGRVVQADADAACQAILANDQAGLIDAIERGGAAAADKLSPVAGTTALHLACSKGNARMLSAMVLIPQLNMDYLINGETALHVAVTSGQERCIQLLLAKADLNAVRQQDGRPPLMLAVQASSLPLTKLLASAAGVHVSAQDKLGDTALHLAIRGRTESLVQLLLDAGADPEVMNAAKETALIAAVGSDDVEMVQLLLKGGADPDAKTEDGTTALSIAAQRDSVAVAHVLLDQEQGRADPAICHEALGTPLHIACAAKAVGMVRVLLEHSAALEVPHPTSRDTPLLACIRSGSEELVRLLLENGANPGVLDGTDLKVPALSVAAQAAEGAPHSGIVHLLLDAGASPAVPDAHGTLPLSLVLLHPDPDYALAKALVFKGAPVNALVDKERKEGLLHKAALAGDEAAVELLLEAGADPQATDHRGYSADIVAKTERIADMITAAAASGAAPLAAAAAEAGPAQAAPRAAAAARAPRAPREKVQRINRLLEQQLQQKNQAAAMDLPPRQVFLSFRVREAKPQALAIKRELQARGMDAFCSECDIPPGADWVKTIFKAMEHATVMVILATETYGSPGTDIFATYEELTAAKKIEMPIYLVKIHRGSSVKDFAVQALLNNLQGSAWLRAEDGGEANNQPPVKLLDDVETMVKQEAAKSKAKADLPP